MQEAFFSLLSVRIVILVGTNMLIVIGMLLVLIQFGIDAYMLAKGSLELSGIVDWLGYFLFGLVGLFLIWIGKVWLVHKVNKLEGIIDDED